MVLYKGMYYHIYSFIGCGIMWHESRVLRHADYFHTSIVHILERRKIALNIWMSICIECSIRRAPCLLILGSGSGPPRAKTQDSTPKPLSNSLQIHRGMEHGSRLMILGPCGHDYYDHRERRKSPNKKGPRFKDLGPRWFNICSLDMRRTHNQSSDHNVC